MILVFKNWWNNKPLQLIIGLALFFRLLAAFFSPGFGMFDDHFLIIEPAQSWVDGFDYNYWLPSETNKEPKGFNFFYTGLHYYFFLFLELFGLNNPEIKMLFVRIIHALWSTLAVFFAYKIAEKWSNQASAKLTGLLMAIYFFFPWISVRNLVESVSIPFILASFYFLICHKMSSRNLILAGIAIGFAVSVRYQVALIFGSLGLALWLRDGFKQAFLFGVGAILVISLTQGLVDYVIWDEAFIQLKAYFIYNKANATTYFVQPWYNYFLVIFGFLIPPISVVFLYLTFKHHKRYFLMFWPFLVFFAFHSYFPNKQERFIIPILPLIIIIGSSAYYEWREKLKSPFFIKFMNGSWRFFWILNSIALVALCLSYNKRNFVESMNFLRSKGQINCFLVDNANYDEANLMPTFYLGLGKKPHVYEVTKQRPAYQLKEHFKNNQNAEKPKFAIFLLHDNLNQRLDSLRTVFPNLVYETTITPGLVDALVYKINPVNENQTCIIYRID